ncbi:MAG: hypothetical protein LBD01_05595 [Puniceicoccales bacterium]|jgi:hypothetical protein|nr:hypothetical protein [Puniceicoccales bacterium]
MSITPVFLTKTTRAILATGCAVLGTAPLGAQQSPPLPRAQIAATVADNAVKFTTVQSSVSAYPMVRIEVPVTALNNAKLLEDKTSIVPNKDWVDKIKVTLTIAYPVSAKAKASGARDVAAYAFYSASSTILTMQRNTKGSVFFYLPGEVIKREQLASTPEGYIVEIEVDGKAQPAILSRKLKTPKEENGFREMAGQALFKTAGVLLPQYHVPDDRRPSSPALIREDSTRQ